ncbi:MAG: OmpA family protein [Clostridiales bacterium]|nr:OmpA family protein [Clostridiales bacterium]
MRSSSIRRRSGSFRTNVDKNSFWLSFSDLMSALVLVVILVLFYMLYQYFLMYDDYAEKLHDMAIMEAALRLSEEDIEAKEAALLAAQSQLDEKNTALSSAQTELTSAQRELTAAQEDLAVQQLLVEAARRAAELTQDELDQQAAELQQTLATLDEQQQQILLQQAQLSAQQGQLDEQQSQIEQLVGVRTRIIASLSEALKGAHISATVDPTSGAIALESDVLFPTGESELSREGKARIDAFLPVYLDVLFSDEYRGYVAEIIIEGHTDSVGGYIDNLRLSQQRAYNVGSYVLADGYPHISGEVREHLRKIATANGRSYSNLIYGADGAENRSASRRVVFKFRLTDEQMVARMQALLEQGN